MDYKGYTHEDIGFSGWDCPIGESAWDAIREMWDVDRYFDEAVDRLFQEWEEGEEE